MLQKIIKSLPPVIKLVAFLLCYVLLEELLKFLFCEHGIDDVHDGTNLRRSALDATVMRRFLQMYSGARLLPGCPLLLNHKVNNVTNIGARQ